MIMNVGCRMHFLIIFEEKRGKGIGCVLRKDEMVLINALFLLMVRVVCLNIE